MMTSGITSDTTAGQRKQYLRFVEDAAEKALLIAGLDKDRLQWLIGNGGEFQARIILAIKELSVTNQFPDEEIESRKGYFSGYKPRNIAEQISILHRFFPRIGSVNEDFVKMIEKGEVELPVNAEGWFAIPHWSKVEYTYANALQRVVDLLVEAYGNRFANFCKFVSKYLREGSRKVRSMEALEQSQNADILIVPAQFGRNYRGRSIRRARAVMSDCEFGLGLYEIGMMLLTHPERLKDSNDLGIDAPGDEYSPNANDDFINGPSFYIMGSKLMLGVRRLDIAAESVGSASGFIPQ